MVRVVLSKARFQNWLRLTRKKDREAASLFIVDGWRWLEEALARAEPPVCVFAVPDAERTSAEAALLARARKEAGEFCLVAPEQLARLTGAAADAGVAAVVRWRAATLEDVCAATRDGGPHLVVALDSVGDPGNAGTIIRTADWFGASAVLFGDGSVEPTNPKVARATMGSLFHVPVVVADSMGVALARLRVAGFSLVGAALDGTPMAELEWPERCVQVIGNEANGIRSGVAAGLDLRVRIPAYGRAESLNAGVAAAILMGEWRRGLPAG